MPAAPRVGGGPTIIAATGIRLDEGRAPMAPAPVAPPVAIVDWKMPTSRALMIGGAATALIGVVAIGGDTGAIVGLTGTAVAVYGLYLHYNR
jgi:hypothetical protein